MKIEEIVEEMNKATGGTLSITRYFTGWELHSYKANTLFSGPAKTISAMSFKGLIEKAYKVLKEAELPEEEQDITMQVI